MSLPPGRPFKAHDVYIVCPSAGPASTVVNALFWLFYDAARTGPLAYQRRDAAAPGPLAYHG